MVKKILTDILTSIFGWKHYCVTYNNPKGHGMKQFSCKRLIHLDIDYILEKLEKKGYDKENTMILNVFRIED